MENILIVCADKNLRKDLSKVLAKELGFLYADVDDILGYELLNCGYVSMSEAGDKMTQLEVKSVNRVLEYDRCIITISNNLFVSNANFKLFSMPKVFIALSKAHLIANIKGDANRLEQELLLFDKINKLISVNCDIVLDKGVKDIDEIARYILDKLNNK